MSIYTHNSLKLEFSKDTIGCKIENMIKGSVYYLQFYADRFCSELGSKSNAGNHGELNFTGFDEQNQALTASWNIRGGQIDCLINFDDHRDLFTWKIRFRDYPYHLFDKYVLAGIHAGEGYFTHHLDPCLFEQEAAYWPGLIPEDPLCIETSGVRIGNNYIINYNAEEAVLIGSLDFNVSSRHKISRTASTVTICYYNTFPKETTQEGIYLSAGTWERCAAIYCQLLEERGAISRREQVTWHTEPQWCDWVPYRWDTSEEKILKNARQIRQSGISVRTIVIDAGWFDYLGDWEPDRKKFPSGMRKLIAELHKMDFKVVLWLCPHVLSSRSRALEVCGDFLVRNDNNTLYQAGAEEKPENIGGYFIDPTDRRGVKFLRDITHKLIKEFDADGLKIDYVYLGPTRRFVTAVPLEENEYVYKIHEIVSQSAREIKKDCLISVFTYSAHIAELGDDIRTGDTFKGCNYRTLSIAKIKTKVAFYQHPHVLLVNDYIGSYDVPIEEDVFYEWIEWLQRTSRAVIAYGWQPWSEELAYLKSNVLSITKKKKLHNRL